MRGTPNRPAVCRCFARFIPAHAGNTPDQAKNQSRRAVHPRACGEHITSSVSARVSDGSSPRMRGTRSPGQQHLQHGRFIPAHAGNTPRGAQAGRPPAVHPRACGEHTLLDPPIDPHTGSSPRMRGTHGFTGGLLATDRFIPAHAGNTVIAFTPRYQKSVHPRACGEHEPQPRPTPCRNGSSPRMRGTRRRAPRRLARKRLIPAHAGNTQGHDGHPGGSAVHPRACGEHAGAHLRPLRRPGSSPRMRGTPRRTVHVEFSARFIPAHAGNTGGAPAALLSGPVHPRACGEHFRGPDVMSSHGGSSPRMRGTHRGHDPDAGQPRFIPAHAGNTCRSSGRRPTCAVHPRACGEHRQDAATTLLRPGSSPRMRGTPPPRPGRARRGRFIPAHAGNTSMIHPAPSARAGSSPRMRGTRGSVTPPSDRRRFIPAHAGNTAAQARKCFFETVHPRACGEHRVVVRIGQGRVGSSPRMRGTPGETPSSDGQSRFIPAHAGNTSRSSPRQQISSVHPRACGEHAGMVGGCGSASGSSPRMRGTHPVAARAAAAVRFIPAHAGNTASAAAGRRGPAVHPRACGEHRAEHAGQKGDRGSSPRMRGTLSDLQALG